MAEPYYPPNAESFATTVVNLPVAGRAVRMPDIPIPEGMPAILKAHPNNLGLVYVGRSPAEASNPLQGYPLVLNEFILLRLKSTSAYYVAPQLAGDNVCIIVEERK